MDDQSDSHDNQEKLQSNDDNAPSGDESSSSREPGKGSLLDKLVLKLHNSADHSREASPEPGAAAEPGATKDDEKRRSSSRRKPTKTHRVVEEDAAGNDEDSIQLESQADETSRDASGAGTDAEVDAEIEKETVTVAAEGDTESIDIDESGNFILPELPEGTVVVEPEAVVDKSPDFQGPEFRSRKRPGRAGAAETSKEHILDLIVCTACNKQINPNAVGNAVRHPVLKVMLCKRCYKYYTSDEIEQDGNGMDEQCRWCGEGGNLLCCDYCHNAFCKTCIKRNLGRTELTTLMEADEDAKWQCYVCDPKPLAGLINYCTKVIQAVAEKAEPKKTDTTTTPKTLTKITKPTGKQTTPASAKKTQQKGGPVVPTQLFQVVGQQCVNISPNTGMRSNVNKQVQMKSIVTKGSPYGQKGQPAKNAPVSTNANVDFDISEQNVVPVLDRMMAATQSMSMLLSSMKDDLVKDLPSFASGVEGMTAAVMAKAQKTRIDVAKRLKRAMLSYRKSLRDIEHFAKSYKTGGTTGGTTVVRQQPKPQPQPQPSPVAKSGMNITPGKMQLVTIKTPEGYKQVLQMQTNKDGTSQIIAKAPYKAVARKSTTKQAFKSVKAKPPPIKSDEVVILDSSDEDEKPVAKKDSKQASENGSESDGGKKKFSLKVSLSKKRKASTDSRHSKSDEGETSEAKAQKIDEKDKEDVSKEEADEDKKDDADEDKKDDADEGKKDDANEDKKDEAKETPESENKKLTDTKKEEEADEKPSTSEKDEDAEEEKPVESKEEEMDEVDKKAEDEEKPSDPAPEKAEDVEEEKPVESKEEEMDTGDNDVSEETGNNDASKTGDMDTSDIKEDTENETAEVSEKEVTDAESEKPNNGEITDEDLSFQENGDKLSMNLQCDGLGEQEIIRRPIVRIERLDPKLEKGRKIICKKKAPQRTGRTREDIEAQRLLHKELLDDEENESLSSKRSASTVARDSDDSDDSDDDDDDTSSPSSSDEKLVDDEDYVPSTIPTKSVGKKGPKCKTTARKKHQGSSSCDDDDDPKGRSAGKSKRSKGFKDSTGKKTKSSSKMSVKNGDKKSNGHRSDSESNDSDFEKPKRVKSKKTCKHVKKESNSDDENSDFETHKNSKSRSSKKVKKESDSEVDDLKSNRPKHSKSKSKVKKEDSENDDSDSEKPQSKSKPSRKSKKKKHSSDESDASNFENSKSLKKASAKNENSSSKNTVDYHSDSSNFDSDLEADIRKLENLPGKSFKKKKSVPSVDKAETKKEAPKPAPKTCRRMKVGRVRGKKDVLEGLDSSGPSDVEPEPDVEDVEIADEDSDGDTMRKELKQKTDAKKNDDDADAQARKNLLDDSSDDDNDDDDLPELDEKVDKVKKNGKEKTKKSEADKNGDDDDDDGVTPIKKKTIHCKLLDAKLSDDSADDESDTEKSSKQENGDSDSDIGVKKKKHKDDGDFKASDAETESEGDDLLDDNSSDSDINPKKKKKKKKEDTEDELSSDIGKKKKKRGRKKAKSESDSDSDDKPKKKGRKRRRIKLASDSEEEEEREFISKKKKKKKKGEPSSSEASEDEDGTPSKGRKNIRKILKSKALAKTTIDAQKDEEDRRKRVTDRQKKYNEVTEEASDELKCPVTTKLVLEADDEGNPIIEVNTKLIRKLKPHQVEAVKFMYGCTIESLERREESEGSGCILAHCMGLGKTLSVISFVHTMLTHFEHTKLATAMIVCPLNTVLNWKHEWEMWFDEEDQLDVYDLTYIKDNYTRADTLKTWQEGGGILIIGYEMYRNLTQSRFIKNKKQKKIIADSLVDPGPDICVCDEGHILKNDTSAISKAMNQMKTRRRIVLTGTPLQNNLGEYHCMLSFVKPNLLGTRKEFGNRFVNPIVNGQAADSTARDVKIMKNRAHILHEMLAGCVQRKDYSALTKYLPPKQEYILAVRLSPLQMELYEEYLKRMGQTEGQVTAKGGRLFSDYQNLMKIWTHPWMLKLDEIRQLNKASNYDTSEDSFVDDEVSDEESKDSGKSSSGGSDEEVKMLSDEEVWKPRSSRSRSCKAGEGGSRSRTRGAIEPQPSTSSGKKGSDSEDEVVNSWKSRSRSGLGEPLVEPEIDPADQKVSSEWWADKMTYEDKYKTELGGKLMLLSNILRMCEEIGDKVLVFSQSLLSLNLIEDFLEYWDSRVKQDPDDDVTGKLGWLPNIDYYRMDGSTSAQNRTKWADDFNEEENHRARLFLISTKAGSLGINLVAANRVIVFDASWNPSHDIQSIFRVYRFGQTKPVYVYRFLAQGTMEEKIYERQVTKQSLAQRVVDEHQIERHFTAADLQELYNFKPDRLDDPNREEPILALPKDRMLADLVHELKDWVVNFHEHDSLLENLVAEELTEEERKAAWEEYEQEKKHGGRPQPNMQAGRPAMNNAEWLQYYNIQQEQQSNLYHYQMQQLMQGMASQAAATNNSAGGQQPSSVLSNMLTGIQPEVLQHYNRLMQLQQMQKHADLQQRNAQDQLRRMQEQRAQQEQLLRQQAALKSTESQPGSSADNAIELASAAAASSDKSNSIFRNLLSGGSSSLLNALAQAKGDKDKQ